MVTKIPKKIVISKIAKISISIITGLSNTSELDDEQYEILKNIMLKENKRRLSA